MPDLQAVYEEFRDRGLVVLGVTMGETAATVAEVVEEEGLSFHTLLDDDGKVAANFRVDVTGHPAHYLIGRSGAIVKFRVGYASREVLTDMLEAAFE